VVSVLQQIRTHHGLGCVQIAIHKQPDCGHHLGGQILQPRDVTRCHCGAIGLPRHLEEANEHAPAARQRMIDLHRPFKSLDGLRRLLHIDEAATALFEEAAEPGVMLLQDVKRIQGFGDAA